MASFTPIVLESTDLAAFVQYVLSRHAERSTLIVCSSKEGFVKQLQAATSEQHSEPQEGGEVGGAIHPSTVLSAGIRADSTERHDWSTPKLRLLTSSRTVKVAFCPEVRYLRAYLATYAHRMPQQDISIATRSGNEKRILAILNPIQSHRPTSAFSAQGLSRTLSIAVEAAHNTGSRLILTECPGEMQASLPEDTPIFGEDHAPAAPPVANVWDEEVSILNVTTKSFGAGERGWVGRTIKPRTIAERWCTFETLSTQED